MNEKYKFTIEELQALHRLFEHQWINREDEEQIQVTNKISRIVNEHERLAARASKSTQEV
jgi:hypothetical protein